MTAAIDEIAEEFARAMEAEPAAASVSAIEAADRSVGQDYGDKMRRLGANWSNILATPAPHDQLSERRQSLICALVKRNFTPGEIWAALATSAWLPELVRRKGERHAERLIATEIAKAQAVVTPFPPDGNSHARINLAGIATAENDCAAPSTEVPAESISGFRTARAIAEETPAEVDWLVLGYLAAGTITEIVGKAKAAGKTTWLMHAIRCVLDGADFMGNPTKRSPVVYLSEERPRSFRETIRRAELTERDDLMVLRWDQVIGWAWADVVRAAIAECKRQGARLLVIDTVSQFAGMKGDSENNAGDALAALQPLQEAAALGIAVAAIRHERKGGGDVGESGRGSSAFAGAVDIHVAVRRPDGQTRPGVRILHALSRFDETPDELMIELTPTGYVALGAPAALAVQDAVTAIVAAIPTNEGDAIAEKELGDAVPKSIKRTTAQSALRALCDDGTVTRTGAGKKGNPYRYWRDEKMHCARTTMLGAAETNEGPEASPASARFGVAAAGSPAFEGFANVEPKAVR